MACLTVGQAGRAPVGRRPPSRPVGPRAANGVTFLVPQELNASRPATLKMDSATMTVCAGNGGAPQRQLVAGTSGGGQGRILGSCDAVRKSGGPLDCSKQRPRPHRKPTIGGEGWGKRTGCLGMAGAGGGDMVPLAPVCFLRDGGGQESLLQGETTAGHCGKRQLFPWLLGTPLPGPSAHLESKLSRSGDWRWFPATHRPSTVQRPPPRALSVPQQLPLHPCPPPTHMPPSFSPTDTPQVPAWLAGSPV